MINTRKEIYYAILETKTDKVSFIIRKKLKKDSWIEYYWPI